MKDLKIIIAIAFTVLSTYGTKAQNNQISFFHLGDYVSQTQDVSPVYIPKNSFTLGLPGISGIGMGFSNGFAGGDLLQAIDGNDDESVVDTRSILNNLDGDYNTLNLNTTVSILNMAFKREKGSLTFFINARENLTWQMSRGFLTILGDGIKDFTLNDRGDGSAYLETGIGFTQQFLDKKLAVGVRLKYLSGIVNASIKEDAVASLDVDNNAFILENNVRVRNDNFGNWNVNASNAVARTSYDEDNVIGFGNNSGFGFDIGATYEIIPDLTIEAAVNDIGSIKWDTNVKEHFVADGNYTITADQIDLTDDGDIGEQILDNLEDRIPTGEREASSYSTSLATSSYVSLSYKLAQLNNFRLTMFNDHSQEDTNPVFAAGYNLDFKKNTLGGVVVSRDGEIDLGVNFALKLGFFQLYMVSDNVDNIFTAPREIKNLNLRLGLNFVFGYNQ